MRVFELLVQCHMYCNWAAYVLTSTFISVKNLNYLAYFSHLFSTSEFESSKSSLKMIDRLSSNVLFPITASHDLLKHQYTLHEILKFSLSFLQIDDSAASGGSPVPALPAYTSSFSHLTFTHLPHRLPHPSGPALAQSDESSECSDAAGVFLPPRWPQIRRGSRNKVLKVPNYTVCHQSSIGLRYIQNMSLIGWNPTHTHTRRRGDTWWCRRDIEKRGHMLM